MAASHSVTDRMVIKMEKTVKKFAGLLLAVPVLLTSGIAGYNHRLQESYPYRSAASASESYDNSDSDSSDSSSDYSSSDSYSSDSDYSSSGYSSDQSSADQLDPYCTDMLEHEDHGTGISNKVLTFQFRHDDAQAMSTYVSCLIQASDSSYEASQASAAQLLWNMESIAEPEPVNDQQWHTIEDKIQAKCDNSSEQFDCQVQFTSDR